MLPLQNTLDQTLAMGHCSDEFLKLLEPKERIFVERLQKKSRLKAQLRRMGTDNSEGFGNNYISIHHGDPCRINEYTRYSRPRFVVIRTMTEGFVHMDHVKCCNKADLVLVPSSWHFNLYKDKGVNVTRLRSFPEAIDTEFFNPYNIVNQQQCFASFPEIGLSEVSPPFVFLSIFAFGYRKGWDILLDAYFTEFNQTDDVLLILRAFRRDDVKATPKKDDAGNYYLNRKENADIATMDGNITKFIASYAFKTTGKRMDQLPRVVCISSTLSRLQLRDLYHASDVFVLPTRGEGWLLPAVEAMAMETPVIVTNSSGPTAYLTDANSYPIRINGIESETGYAKPSQSHLQVLMRQAYTNQDEGKAKGKQAREDMVKNFSPLNVSQMLLQHLDEITSRRE